MKVNYSAVVYYCVTCYCNIQLQKTFVCVFTLEYVRYSFRVWAVRCHLQSYVTNNWQCNAINQEQVAELFQKTFFWNNSAIWYRLNAYLWNTVHSADTQHAYSSVSTNKNLWYLTENYKILACNVCSWNLDRAGVLKNEWWKVYCLCYWFNYHRINFLSFLWTYRDTVGKYMHSSTVTIYNHRPWREPGTANPRNIMLE